MAFVTCLYIASSQLIVKTSVLPCIECSGSNLLLSSKIISDWKQQLPGSDSNTILPSSAHLKQQYHQSYIARQVQVAIQRGQVTQGKGEPEIYAAAHLLDRLPLEILVLFTLCQKGVFFERP